MYKKDISGRQICSTTNHPTFWISKYKKVYGRSTPLDQDTTDFLKQL